MENASNALIIAASVLLALMIISFGTFLFAIFGNNSRNIDTQISKKEVQEFNAKFLKYTEQDCTVYDIVTIINLAKDNNSKYENEGRRQTNYISVKVNGKSNINEKTSDNILEQYISEYENNKQIFFTEDDEEKVRTEKQFNCEVEINENTGYVELIKFTEKP